MTPRAIPPTALVLIGLAAGGTWQAIDAMLREHDQAEQARIAATFAEPGCLRFCPDCPEFCPPPIREASETHGRVLVSTKGERGRSGQRAPVLLSEVGR